MDVNPGSRYSQSFSSARANGWGARRPILQLSNCGHGQFESSSNSELEGPIEELLFDANGQPIELRIYGVTVNIEGARTELDSSVPLVRRNLALTQFVEG